jgi:hypothetical protein
MRVKMLKKIILIPALFAFCAGTAFAQNDSNSTTAKRKKVSRTEPYWQLGTGAVMWQEPIPATRGTIKGDLETQSIGARIAMTHNQFYQNSRWRKFYSFAGLFGTVKGKSFDPNLPDELNKQPWLAFESDYGWIYRTAPASEMGLFIPVVARYITWDLNSGAQLKMDRQFSGSAGLGGIYTNRFSTKQAFNITVVHQQIWHATVWGLSWEETL